MSGAASTKTACLGACCALPERLFAHAAALASWQTCRTRAKQTGVIQVLHQTVLCVLERAETKAWVARKGCAVHPGRVFGLFGGLANAARAGDAPLPRPYADAGCAA